MKNVIEIRGLNKTYEKFALTDISFSIPEGCIVGFIGLNGQGKTTTIRSMLGLSQKDSGQISIFGMDLDEDSRQIKDRIGVVFDEGYLYDSLKIREMKSIISKAYSNWDDSSYYKYLNKFSLDENQKIATLSKGMKMKFALTLALSHHAELLIMDEPTSGLDPLVRKELMEILNDFMKVGGKGVFYSSHITSDLDKFADIIVFINKGQIVFVKDKDSLLDSYVRVKGDKALINEESKKYFLSLKESDYGFSGITERLDELNHLIPGIIVERINIEDIMLAYVEGGSLDA